MNKVFHPEFDQAELIKAAGKIVTLVDGSSNQRIKSAASSAVSEQLIRENLPDDNHFAVHLIALGDGEEYGPNRNNDYFSKRANKKYHPTFVSHGHFFREHNNRDPKNAIGIVKASAHNADMSRVELIIHGDKKKAEEEYELLKKDASLSFSMSCKIATDVCNCCGNKAANRSQYCDCMKHHAGEYMPEFKKFAYVDNPDPVFFDISRVKSPADRIAHYLEYVDGALSKAAHAHKPILGAELADLEGVNLPHSPDEYFNQQERKILQKLAYNEAYLENVFKGADVPRDNKYNFTKYALNMMVPRDTADKSIVEGLCAHDLPILMRKLATAKVILPFKSFYSMINGEDPETLDFDPTYKHACAAVPNTFRSLEDGSNKVLQVGFTSSYFDPACDQVDACNTDEFEKAMDYFIHKFSLRQLEEPTVQIIQVSAQPSLSEDFKMKEASVVDKNKSEIAVGLYGLYKLSCCKQLASELDAPKYLTITYLK